MAASARSRREIMDGLATGLPVGVRYVKPTKRKSFDKQNLRRRSPLVGSVAIGESRYKVEDPFSNLGVFDSGKSPIEMQALGG